MSEKHEIYSRLAGLPGSAKSGFSLFPQNVSVVVDSTATGDLVSETSKSLIRAEARVEPEVNVMLANPGDTRQAKRSRFDSLTTSQRHPGRFAARVTLEWDSRVVEGVAEGEMNQLAELRICASAALRAVEEIAAGSAAFNVIGVKELRVFDHNLVVVLVHSPQLADQRLFGTAVITGDRCRAAALAALNATNRVLGRFIQDG